MEFKSIKRLISSLSRVGFTKEERKKVLTGNIPKYREDGIYSTLRPYFKDKKKNERLREMLEIRSGFPVPFEQIFKSAHRFDEIGSKLTEKMDVNDVKAFNFLLDYLENWFFEGKWSFADLDFRYLHVPASILNILTKVKEKRFRGEVGKKMRDINLEKVMHLISEVDLFFERSVNQGNVDERISKAYRNSKQSVLNALLIDGNPAAKIYFLKNCLIAAAYLNRERSSNFQGMYIIKNAEPEIGGLDYKLFDFSDGKDPSKNSIHMSKSRFFFCTIVVEYLRSINSTSIETL